LFVYTELKEGPHIVDEAGPTKLEKEAVVKAARQF
jgi:hypothetical protein